MQLPAAKGSVSVSITNLQGKVVYQGMHSANEPVSLGENLANGVYLLTIQIDNQIQTKRIVKIN